MAKRRVGRYPDALRCSWPSSARAREPFRALCRCITVVHQGQFWANTEQVGFVIEALDSCTPSRVINARGDGLLTPGEDQVVNRVAEGIGNREIAQQLGIKENTVKKSLLRIDDKLGVSNRVELVLYALTHRGALRKSSLPSPRARTDHVDVDCLDPNQVNLLSACAHDTD